VLNLLLEAASHPFDDDDESFLQNATLPYTRYVRDSGRKRYWKLIISPLANSWKLISSLANSFDSGIDTKFGGNECILAGVSHSNQRRVILS
jgi:hypothetical protein